MPANRIITRNFNLILYRVCEVIVGKILAIKIIVLIIYCKTNNYFKVIKPSKLWVPSSNLGRITRVNQGVTG